MRNLAMIAAAGLALSACSVSQDKASAEAGVVHFHEMLDAGRYRDIFAGGEPELQVEQVPITSFLAGGFQVLQ